ncbi:hypothetical protein WJX73_010744 [Symbiochloris irregularis]|uniref:Uncharacterized protein n=1 Tax=Symbiochloris irregularis TaxID=706552 RepID=A0AAW1NXR4_9CHLO
MDGPVPGFANYRLFWVQHAEGFYNLAVMGVDARGTRHFTYASHPEFTSKYSLAALRGTNRSDVILWLEAIGAGKPMEDTSIIKVSLPDYTSKDLQHLSNAVMEEIGQTADQRQCKRFYLREEGSREEHLAVEGIDSPRGDRKYTYKLTPYFKAPSGRGSFTNTHAVKEWLTKMVADPDANPDPVPRQAPVQRALLTPAADEPFVQPRPSHPAADLAVAIANPEGMHQLDPLLEALEVHTMPGRNAVWTAKLSQEVKEVYAERPDLLKWIDMGADQQTIDLLRSQGMALLGEPAISLRRLSSVASAMG